MPPHTRSQRRRQPAKQPPRQRTDIMTDTSVSLGNVEQTLASPTVSATLPTLQEVPVSAVGRTEVVRPVSARRANTAAVASDPRGASPRRRARPDLTPVDYTSDYRSVRHDLRWIAIWTVLLFVAMFALHFSGIAL